MLHVQSDSLGFLAPRMTTAQRNAISDPTDGLLVYDTSTGSFWYHQGSTWIELAKTAVITNDTMLLDTLAIPDSPNPGVSDTINISQPGKVDSNTNVRVCIDITHTYDADLDISLIAPSGDTMDLTSDNGSFGDNYTNSCFTTDAVNLVTGGSAPFTGDWIPESPFSTIYGSQIEGDWILMIVDDTNLDTGTLHNWYIEISNPTSFVTPLIQDADCDTKVEVEKFPDGDIIHLEAGGFPVMELSSSQIGMPFPDPLSQVNIASVGGFPNTLQVSGPAGLPIMWASDAFGPGAGIMAINPPAPAPGPPAHLWIAGAMIPEMIHVDDFTGTPIMLMMNPAATVGDLIITGTLFKGAVAFKIDHPVDPENKFLMHTAIESPDMMNVYNGNITTDENGLATVILEDYFEALNRDFRYQLTVIGTFAQAIIKEEVTDNKFVIQTSVPNVKVSWQITGIRHDPYAEGHRTPHVLDKTQEEKGKYLHSHYYGQSIEKQIGRTPRN